MPNTVNGDSNFFNKLLRDIVYTGDIPFINDLRNSGCVSKSGKYFFLNRNSTDIKFEEDDEKVTCLLTFSEFIPNLYEIYRIILHKAIDKSNPDNDEEKSNKLYSDISVHYTEFNLDSLGEKSYNFECGYIQRCFCRYDKVPGYVMRENKKTVGFGSCRIGIMTAVWPMIVQKAEEISSDLFLGQSTGYKFYFKTIARQEGNGALVEYVASPNTDQKTHRAIYEKIELPSDEDYKVVLPNTYNINLDRTIKVLGNFDIVDDSYIKFYEDGTYTKDSKEGIYKGKRLIRQSLRDY